MSAIPPTNNPGLIIDNFILYATSHLSSVSGIVNTVSLYPPIGTPGPGIVQWSGYSVTPASAGGAGVVGVTADNLAPDPTEVNTNEIEMNNAQLAASEEASLRGEDINTATAEAFSGDTSIPTTEEEQEQASASYAQSSEKLEEDARREPDPPLNEDEKPKDNIQPEANFKSKLKVPPELVVAMRKYGIAKTPLERAHFLAQTNHESGNFIYKEEIASGTAYEGRKDLGNTEPGDGPKYKGRGYIQLTGRANYRKFGPTAGADFEGNPKIVASKYFADTACMFWKSNRLGDKCKDSSITSIKVVTKRINGGYNGLDDRVKKFTKYWEDLQKDPTLWA